jgi:hypothetical protein
MYRICATFPAVPFLILYFVWNCYWIIIKLFISSVIGRDGKMLCKELVCRMCALCCKIRHFSAWSDLQASSCTTWLLLLICTWCGICGIQTMRYRSEVLSRSWRCRLCSSKDGFLDIKSCSSCDLCRVMKYRFMVHIGVFMSAVIKCRLIGQF